MNTQPIAVKFVSWEINPLDTLRDSRVYNLRDRLNNGEKMNREDKIWLAENLQGTARVTPCPTIPITMSVSIHFKNEIQTYLEQRAEYNQIGKGKRNVFLQ